MLRQCCFDRFEELRVSRSVVTHARPRGEAGRPRRKDCHVAEKTAVISCLARPLQSAEVHGLERILVSVGKEMNQVVHVDVECQDIGKSGLRSRLRTLG